MRVASLPDHQLIRLASSGELCWQVGPFVIRFQCQRPKLTKQIAWLYRHFPLHLADCIPSVDLQLESRWLGNIRIRVDGDSVYDSIPERLAVPLAEWTLNVNVFQRPQQCLMIHAAVVERNGLAVILPGLAGAGKSTLCATLVLRGWRLLSDEVAMVRPSDGALLPVPRPISLKENSIDFIKSFSDGAVLGPTWKGTAKGNVAHMLPPLSSVEQMHMIARPKWLIFPQYQAGSSLQFDQHSKALALLETASHAFNYSVLGQPGFTTLSRLIDECDCYRLTYSNTPAALELFEKLHHSTTPQQSIANYVSN